MNEGKGIKGVDKPAANAADKPVVNSPAPNENVKNPVTFSGTGLAGWVVYVYSVPTDGEPIASAFVGENGEWSTPVSLDVRLYSVFALQKYNGETSGWTDIFDFAVIG